MRFPFYAPGIVAILSGPAAPAAEVLWYGDPTKPLTDSFRQLNRDEGEAGTASVVSDPDYGQVWSVNKPSGSKRAEFARTNGYIPAEGDKVYVGWRVKVDIAGSENPGGGFAIFQLKTEGNGEQNHPVSIDYDGRKMEMKGVVPGSGSVSSRTIVFCGKPMAENTWTEIVLGFHFSKDARKGYVEAWINGTKQDLRNQNPLQQAYHRTLDAGTMYFKWGAYNEASRRFNITVNMDEMRVGTTLASVTDALEGRGVTLGIVPSGRANREAIFANGTQLLFRPNPGSISITDLAGRAIGVRRNASMPLR